MISTSFRCNHMDQRQNGTASLRSRYVGLHITRLAHLRRQSLHVSTRRSTQLCCRRQHRCAQISEEAARVRQVSGARRRFRAPHHRSLCRRDYSARTPPRQKTRHRSRRGRVRGHALLKAPLARHTLLVLANPKEDLCTTWEHMCKCGSGARETKRGCRRFHADWGARGKSGRVRADDRWCGTRPESKESGETAPHETILSAEFRQKIPVNASCSPRYENLAAVVATDEFDEEVPEGWEESVPCFNAVQPFERKPHVRPPMHS